MIVKVLNNKICEINMKQYLEVVLTALYTYRGKEEKVKLYKLSIYFSKLGDEQQN